MKKFEWKWLQNEESCKCQRCQQHRMEEEKARMIRVINQWKATK